MKTLALIFGFICVVSACDSSAEPLRLHLSYYPTVSAAGIFLAQERGWYKKADIDLKIIFKDLHITEKVLDGTADMALHSAHEVMRTVDRGKDVKAFAADFQLNPLSLASQPQYESLESLKGKTIGIFTEQEKDFLKVMFANAGLSMDDFIYKPIQTFEIDDLIQKLKTGEYNAIPVWEFNHPVGFALKGYNVRQFQSYRYGFHFYGAVFFAKTDTIRKRKSELARFIEITRRGLQEAYKNPEKSVAMAMARWYPPNQYINGNRALTEKQQLIQMKISKRYFFEGVGIEGYGSMTKFHWDASTKIAKRFDIIKNKNLKAEDFYTEEVMKLVAENSKVKSKP